MRDWVAAVESADFAESSTVFGSTNCDLTFSTRFPKLLRSWVAQTRMSRGTTTSMVRPESKITKPSPREASRFPLRQYHLCDCDHGIRGWRGNRTALGRGCRCPRAARRLPKGLAGSLAGRRQSLATDVRVGYRWSIAAWVGVVRGKNGPRAPSSNSHSRRWRLRDVIALRVRRS